MRGLARALIPLALECCAIIAALALLLVLAAPAIGWVANTGVFGFAGFAGLMVVVVAVSALPAWPCGRVLSHRLTERLGFEGFVPAVLGALFMGVAVLAASAIAVRVTQTHTWLTNLVVLAIGIEGTIVIVWRTWIDPE